MTTIEQLRQTLAEQQRHAPEGQDLLQNVHALAAGRRRRRRGATWAASGVAVLVVTVALTVLMRQPQTNQPPTAATATSTPTRPPYRQPGEMTLALVSGSGYFALNQGINGSYQFMTLRAKPGAGVSYGGDVRAYDPGTFDPSRFLAGEPLVIEGQTTNAYYVENYYGPGLRPAIGWQEAGGVWIEVGGDQNKDGLVRLAQDVRLTPAQEFKTAFHLSYVPSGMHLVYLGREEGVSLLRTRIGFNERPGSIESRPFQDPSRKVAIEVDVLPRDDYIDHHTDDLGTATPTGNLEVHYVTGANAGGLSVPNGGAIVNIRNNKCNAMIIILDNGRFPRAEQERMVAGFQFADCKRPQTWVRPV
jgi:hypothetical protein